MSTRVFVPADSTARSLGADAVAEAIAAREPAVEIVRTGSRGLYWLEPLVEIETAGGRIGFGPVDDAGALFGDGIPGIDHPDCLGPVEALPALACQQRVTTARFGITDPLSLADYRKHGGLVGLDRARGMAPRDIVQTVIDSGLRGRGGAAFPTGIKWQTVLEADANRGHPDQRGRKYIVCNADEGDSGTFIDRMIMECDPYMLIEGMLIAGLAVGADSGFIYCRAEYPQAIETLGRAIATLEEAGHLDGFTLEVREAAGAYICGEETSLLESLEGRRGLVRHKPPLPAIAGLFGQPTVINNVVSLAAVAGILADGAAAYQSLGYERSRGTLTVQIGGNIRRGGLFELPFGMPLADVLALGGGTRSGRPIKAVQVGGPLGAYLPPSQFDTPLDYEAFKAIGGVLGHGGIVVFDEATDLGEMARFAMEFCCEESCGKCTPCRVGSARGVEIIDRIRSGDEPDHNRELLAELCETMAEGSLCAMGGMTPIPVRSIIKHWPGEL
jgi:formate dehydrogenase iron-sulfur subunit